MSYPYVFFGKGKKYVEMISRLLGADFDALEEADGISFVHVSGKRLMKLIDSKDIFKVVFDVPVPDMHHQAPTVHQINVKNEQGHSQWLYEGDVLEEIITLIEIALKNFE
jgi:hypothetical protein